MSRGAVQKYGISELEAMNAAGGGTNLPKMMKGITYAAGGGMVGKEEGYEKPDKMLTPVDPFETHKRYSDFGYRLGQINPETLMMSKTEMNEKTSMVEGIRQPRGQGGRVLGSTTARGNLGTRLYENGHLIRSYNKFRNKREYEAPEGIMRALAGIGDLLTGDLFDFDRKTDRGNVSERRIVHTEMGEDYRVTDDTTIKKSIAAIGRPDLIENQQQILKQLPEGTTIQDVMKGASAIPGVTSDQLLRILATSDAQKATNLKQKRARQLDMAIRGVKPGEGMSMVAGDMTPEMLQGEATANKRHAELMKSTNPEKIAAYDKKHGQGAYSHKLKEKLYRTYGAGESEQTQPIAPTGQVVGRENLPAETQRVLAKMDAQKAGNLPPDMQTSGPLLGRMAMGMMGGLNNMLSGLTGGISGAISDPKSFVESMGGTVKDGNIGKPTAQEQKDFDTLAASKAELARSQKRLAALQQPSQPKVNMMPLPLPQTGGDAPPAPRGGSRTPEINAGDGSASKRKILGIF